jgi:hypothetical protein
MWKTGWYMVSGEVSRHQDESPAVRFTRSFKSKTTLNQSIYCIFHKSMYIDIESVMNTKYKI